MTSTALGAENWNEIDPRWRHGVGDGTNISLLP